MSKKTVKVGNYKNEIIEHDESSTPTADTNASMFDVVNDMENRLTSDQLKHVKQIGYAIGSVGLSYDDACLHSRVKKSVVDNWKSLCPSIETFFRIKRLEYKYKLLEIINGQALENKDVKMATWLLEQHFAEDYDSSVKKEMEKLKQSQGEDVMEMAIAFVRRTSSHETPVNEDAVKAEQAVSVEYKEIDEILK